jgi:predicted  nucleic acid-binding Zn-ribbon protein
MEQESLAPLVEFIGKKFEEVDQHFGAIDTKIADTRRHFDVVAERMQSQVQLVAEGITAVGQRLDRFEQKVEAEFAETRAAIRFSYTQLERRLQELETNYVGLNERVGRLESRTA